MFTRRAVALSFAFFIFTAVSWAQQVGEVRDIAVLSLSYGGWRLPPGALNLVDDQIEEVFTGIGGFEVIGMPSRLEESNVESFITVLREMSEENFDVPESVSIGKVAFSKADFTRLAGAYLVVVPNIVHYESAADRSEAYRVELKTLFTIIESQEARIVGSFEIVTDGSGDTTLLATRVATDAIAEQLQFELRRIAELRLRTGIVEVSRGNVLLEYGRRMGVRRGDEYAVTETRILPSGESATDEVGLFIVKDVEADISFAQMIYALRKPQAGDRLEKVPRLGFDTQAYFRLLSDLAFSGIAGLFGVRQSTSRGFYSFRPFIGLEMPFGITLDLGLSGATVNFYGGGELNWYIRRLQIIPSVAIGIAASAPSATSDSFKVSHIGGFFELAVSYLVSRNLKVGADIGYTTWFAPGEGSSYACIVLGPRMTYKY